MTATISLFQLLFGVLFRFHFHFSPCVSPHVCGGGGRYYMHSNARIHTSGVQLASLSECRIKIRKIEIENESKQRCKNIACPQLVCHRTLSSAKGQSNRSFVKCLAIQKTHLSNFSWQPLPSFWSKQKLIHAAKMRAHCMRTILFVIQFICLVFVWRFIFNFIHLLNGFGIVCSLHILSAARIFLEW